MISKRQKIITIETCEVFVIRRSRNFERIWCRECAEQVVMLTVDEAATAANLSSQMIYRLAQAGDLHFMETPEGWLRICLTSLCIGKCADNDSIQLHYKSI